MTISLTVILIESTNEISLGLPIMLSLLVCVCVCYRQTLYQELCTALHQMTLYATLVHSVLVPARPNPPTVLRFDVHARWKGLITIADELF